MEKLNTSNQIQEQYENITVAAFMEQYANCIAADAAVKEMAKGEFPAELERRCQKLMKQARAKSRGKKVLHTCLRAGRVAAIFVLVLLLAGTTLFFSVESFRIDLMNRYFEHKNGYVKISPRDAIKVGYNVDLDDPLRLMLEPDFELTYINNIGGIIAQYDAPDGRSVVFHINDARGVLQIDTEDSSVTQFLSGGYEVLWAVKEKDNRHIFVWVDEQREQIYQLTTWSIPKAEAVSLCSEVIMVYDGIH